MPQLTISLRKDRNFYALVAILFLAGLFLRLYPGFDKLLFSYDQARDAFISTPIYQEFDIKILGPSSDLPGVFHGPLFYYLIGFSYALFGGNPNATLILMIFVNLATLIPLGVLTHKLFRSRLATLFTLAIFAASFEMHSYARWISNPSLAIPATALAYLGFWLVVKNKKWGWILSGLGVGLAIQAEIFLLYLLPLFAVLILLFPEVKKNIRSFVYFLIPFLLSIATFIAAELKFGFAATRGLLAFATEQANIGGSATQFFTTYIDRATDAFLANTLGLNPAVAFVFAVLVLGTSVSLARKGKFSQPLRFLLVLFAGYTTIFIFTTVKASFVNVGVSIPVIILTGFFLWRLWEVRGKTLPALLFLLIILGNLAFIAVRNRQTTPIFEIQRGMTLADEKTVVTRSYELAQGEPFSLVTVTNPLFVNTTWAYLYKWYGQQVGGYLPVWSGRPQAGWSGEGVLEEVSEPLAHQVLIIEPGPGIPGSWVKAIVAEENTKTAVVSEDKIGTFTLQLRRPLTEAERRTQEEKLELLRQRQELQKKVEEAEEELRNIQLRQTL